MTLAASLTFGFGAMVGIFILVVLAFAMDAWADGRKEKRERK